MNCSQTAGREFLRQAVHQNQAEWNKTATEVRASFKDEERQLNFGTMNAISFGASYALEQEKKVRQTNLNCHINNLVLKALPTGSNEQKEALRTYLVSKTNREDAEITHPDRLFKLLNKIALTGTMRSDSEKAERTKEKATSALTQEQRLLEARLQNMNKPLELEKTFNSSTLVDALKKISTIGRERVKAKIELILGLIQSLGTFSSISLTDSTATKETFSNLPNIESKELKSFIENMFQLLQKREKEMQEKHIIQTRLDKIKEQLANFEEKSVPSVVVAAEPLTIPVSIEHVPIPAPEIKPEIKPEIPKSTPSSSKPLSLLDRIKSVLSKIWAWITSQSTL